MKAAAAAVMAVCAASAAQAAGFMLTEQSAGSLGRAYAGVGVDGTDISGVFYNPATMTLHPGTQIQAGFVAVGLDLAYEGDQGDTENGAANTQPIPFGYISHQMTDNMWIGLAMTVPFGMGTDYSENWALAGRGISAKVLTFDFNPNVAWKLSDTLSLGAGMSLQYASADLKLKKSQSLGQMGSATFDSEIDADSIAWGFNVGLMWSPLDNLRFGLSYRSRINHNADGDLTSSMMKTYDATATLSTPAWAMATAAWDVNDLVSLYATFRWTDWSIFSELKINSVNSAHPSESIVNKWQDTYLFSVGTDLRFTNWWTFRAGIGYETSPIDDPKTRTAIIPDADRWWFALGSSFQATDYLQLDVSAAWLHGTGERDLYDTEGQKQGRFDKLDAYLLGVQLVYKF